MANHEDFEISKIRPIGKINSKSLQIGISVLLERLILNATISQAPCQRPSLLLPSSRKSYAHGESLHLSRARLPVRATQLGANCGCKSICFLASSIRELAKSRCLTGTLVTETGESYITYSLQKTMSFPERSWPRSTGALTKLDALLLNDNDFTGTIPTDLDNLLVQYRGTCRL